MPRRRKCPSTRRSGVAAVEFAVVLPLLVLITLATIEACTMIFLKQSLEIAAYEGARVTTVPRTDENNVIGTSQNILDVRGVQGGTIAVSPSDFAAAAYGTMVTVTVTAPCDANSIFPSWFYAGRTMSAEVNFMKEFD